MKTIISKILIASFDILWLIFLFYLTIFVRKNLVYFGLSELSEIKLIDFIFVIIIIFLLFVYENIYKYRYDFWQDTYKVLKSLVISFFIVLAILSLANIEHKYSRAFILIYFANAMLFIPILKRYTKKILFMFDIFKNNVLVLGKDVDLFASELSENWYLGQKYNKDNYDNVILISKGMKASELNNKIERYLTKFSELSLVPYLDDINFTESEIFEYFNIRMNTIQVKNKLLLRESVFIKNLFDKIIVILISPIFLILHIFISLAIKLDSKGEVIFKQHRLGKDNVDFTVYKYRTMLVDGEKVLDEYLRNNPDEIENYEKYHKYKNDPRITRVGKFLRATSLDELPQIINVIKGDMSFVGPRPYMLNEADKLDKNKELILKSKPGITGLWQVSGRNNLTFQDRVKLDTWYVKNWSFWTDFVIIIKTIKVVIKRVGAR